MEDRDDRGCVGRAFQVQISRELYRWFLEHLQHPNIVCRIREDGSFDYFARRDFLEDFVAVRDAAGTGPAFRATLMLRRAAGLP